MPRKVKAISEADGNQVKMRRLSEQVFPGGNIDAGTSEDDRLFSNLEQTSPLDLPIQSLQTAQRLSLLLYRKNGRAYNLIELKNDFVTGDEIRITANDDKVEDLLMEHWEVNEWSEKLPERLRALSVFGEQLYPVFKVSKDGIIELATITPLRIISVKRDRKNPEEIDKIVTGKPLKAQGSLIFTGVTVSRNTSKSQEWDIIRQIGEKRKLVGNAFFFAVNRISGSTRGLPDLLNSIDWLEGLDGAVWSSLERHATANKVVHDIEYTGLTSKEIKVQLQEFTTNLKDGGAYGHNEKVKYQQQVPKLGSSEFETTVRILLKQIQAGTRMSGMFYGDSDDLTRASAAELSVPVAKMIQARQNTVKRMFEKIFKFQIQQGIAKNRLQGVTDFGFELIMPQVLLKDQTQITASLAQLTPNLEIGLQNGWVNSREAKDVYRTHLQQLGLITISDAEKEPDALLPDEEKVGQMMDVARNRQEGNKATLPEDEIFNGAQMKVASGLIAQVAKGELPRASGIQMLVNFLKIPSTIAEQVMGEVGKTFFVSGESGHENTKHKNPEGTKE